MVCSIPVNNISQRLRSSFDTVRSISFHQRRDQNAQGDLQTQQSSRKETSTNQRHCPNHSLTGDERRSQAFEAALLANAVDAEAATMIVEDILQEETGHASNDIATSAIDGTRIEREMTLRFPFLPGHMVHEIELQNEAHNNHHLGHGDR
eukprot:CAMPEP_0197237420 /NCGR_PEP_ID=MMETSP1429-20130617/4250_1 /TAXON_ID=49237 /ORGANISM="Chaetoceros  sp., Strain UNC1202" /LENGTH=149 /DNA_ID=CAMNT_0042696407 /DNA_START=267 /DNA_END=716 /DNA_ORIENTATION=-